MSQETNILQYVKHMTEKNYAEANKYLHAALQDKMKERMASVVKNTSEN